MNNGPGGVFQDFVGLIPGQLYHVDARTQAAPGTTNQALLWVHDTIEGKAAFDGFRTPSGTLWDLFAVNFTASATGKIRVHLEDLGGSGALYWDDVRFTTGWLGDFESGETTGWAPFGSAVSAVSTALPNQGVYSLAICANSGGMYQDVDGLVAGRSYHVTVRVRSVPGTVGTALLWIHDTLGNGAVADGPRAAPLNGWEEFAVNFVATATGKLRIHLYYGGGAGCVYFDDVLATQSWQTGFENGMVSPWLPYGSTVSATNATTAWQGLVSLAETGGSGGVYQDVLGLTPGRTYRITARAKSSAGAAAQTILYLHDGTQAGTVIDGPRVPNPSDWELFAANFVATATGKVRVHLHSNGGAGTLYWDDVQVVEVLP